MTSRNRCASKQFLTARRVRSLRFVTSGKVRAKVEVLRSRHRKRLLGLNSRSNSLVLNDHNNKPPIRDASSDVLSRNSDVLSSNSDASQRRKLNVQRDQHDSRRRANVLPHLGNNSLSNNDARWRRNSSVRSVHRCAGILVR